MSAGVPQQVVLFDAETGNQIEDKDVIDKVSKLNTSLSDLEFVTYKHEKKGMQNEEIVEESQSVVVVSSGDQWSDYKPSRPQDFVGREELQKDVFGFLNNILHIQTTTRLVAIKTPSGWGKSSMLIKLSAKARSKYKNKFHIHAVDVRAANSPRYGEFAFLDCIKKAIKSGFIKKPVNDITLSSINSPFNDLGIKEIAEFLKIENKVLVLFFDQFEDILSKTDLEKLFDNIRNLSMAIDSEQENIVLGFAWKTDGTTPTEHSAYHMWQSLSDRRKEFELSVFSPNEITKALTLFSKELGMPLNNTLKRYLIDHCQGYPWLLKKLSIHVHTMIKSGISQVNVLGRYKKFI
ncbi:nSTAND1 domain-containing NTPase [Peribacillus frigoritolerans]|uniref:nSTAND1 domain-containing NTPase n=1 Tax=Peribacillus frigoritolerans TaxID=450367 RepID=UPI0026AE94F4